VFSPEELSAMAAADAEIEAEFLKCPDLFYEPNSLDRELDHQAHDTRHRKVNREWCKRYYAEHKEEIKAKSKAYYWSHRDACLAYHRSRKAYNAAKMRKYRAKKKAARESTSPTSGARKNNPTAIIQPESEICQ
jgi:hypothetical protein